MARVTDTEVKEIIETDLNTNPFINTANVMVNKYLVGQECMDAATLKEVELYLAAHFTTMRERQLESEKVSRATDKYLGKADMGLDFSQYGQTAMLLDCSGKLASLNQRKVTAIFEVIQDNYVNN